MTLRRRNLLALGVASVLLPARARKPSLAERPPIVFMHGNGDSAALWLTTIWRFESNGWPKDRLIALEQPWPLARDDDSVAQPGRGSTAESAAFLKDRVDQVLASTGAGKVILIGNSRGGNTIRNYVQNFGGARVVAKAVLGGDPAHGVQAIAGNHEGSEFSGLSPFIRQLNEPKGPAGNEVTPGVEWMTVRSEKNDKFAQPDGRWLGAPGTPTFIGYDGPALKGATNVALPKVDHHETSFSPAAFALAWKFLTGEAPRTIEVVPQSKVKLSGRVTGLGLNPLDAGSGDFVNNLPLRGAHVAVFATNASGARRGNALLDQTVAADGLWGPVETDSATRLEFVITAPGYATTHIYRSPFPRSSDIVNMRPERIANEDRGAGAIVVFTRPRGYFDAERDTMKLDGKSALPGVPASGASVSSAKLKLESDVQRSITGEFNGETVTGMTWPAAQGHVSMLELTW